MENLIGMEIGNYRVDALIGEGGMGTVYRGVEISLDRPVAIKVLNDDLARNPEVVERFRSEARAQANLNHTNIATLYTFLQHNGNAMMVMEYLEGETFQQMVDRRGPINANEAVPLFKQALLGIGAAHRMGIVHRDIKPANLMLTKAGLVKVMDFGIARVMSERRLTRTGVQVGTVFYMSPEQVRGGRVDVRSDIYSLGVTLYELLTAHVPFAGDSDFQILTDHVNTPPPLPTHFYPYIPKGVEKIVLKALEKNPDDRFQSVEEFGAALEHPERWENYDAHPGRQEAAGQAGAVVAPGPPALPPPIQAASPQPVPPAAPKPARPPFPKWLIPVAAAAMLVVLGGGGFLAYKFWPRPPKPPVAVVVSNGGSKGVTPGQGDDSLHPLSTGQTAQGGTNPLGAPTPSPIAQQTPPARNATPGRNDSAHRVRPAAPSEPYQTPQVQQPVPQPTPAAPIAPPAPVVQQVAIPASTQLTLRTIGPIDGDAAQPGRTFAASVDAAVMVNGKIVVPRHADAVLRLVEAKKAGRFHGAAKLVLTLDSFTVGGRRYSVSVTPVDVAGGGRGGRTGKFAVVGGAVGAVVGGVVHGGKGALAGAGIGGGAGAGAAGLTGERGLTLPAESRLTFQLAAPVTVTVQ
jgi:predicted Ser/Thr protein kinase